MESPKLRLSRLRDIGFRHWDPIGLLTEGETWDHKPFANEYDGYLREVAGLLRQGDREEVAVEMLVRAEVEYMGLGEGRRIDAERRAKLTVAAIQKDADLWSPD